MFKRMLLGAVAALGVALTLAATPASAKIKIATAGPMTGEYAAFGQQMRAGAEQAVADINKAGGVLGQQLALEVGDDACDPKQAVSVANDLASKGIDPEGYVLYTYAAVQVWAQAAQKANSTDPKKVAAAMHTGTWQTVLGPITFDKKGDVTVSDYVFYIWANGSYAEM